MRKKLETVPGVSALLTTPLGMRIDEGLGGTPSDLSLRVFGPDLDELVRLGEDVRQVMSRVDGITDLRVEQLSGLPQLRLGIALPLLVLRLHGTEIERPLAVVMIGGLVTSTLFTLLALPTFYLLAHRLFARATGRAA